MRAIQLVEESREIAFVVRKSFVQLTQGRTQPCGVDVAIGFVSAVAWPSLSDLAKDEALHGSLAGLTDGWDGRRLRKLPLAVLGADPALARDPERLTAERLLGGAVRSG